MTRVFRRLVYIGLATLAVVAVAGRPAGAHAGAVLTIHSDGTGSIWVTARWVDGHPVTGPATAIVTASSATGQRVGPAPLRTVDDGNGTLTYTGQLAAGQWSVTAEMASPAVARCDTQVLVGRPATPAAVTCTPEEVEPAAALSDGGSSPPWLAIVLVAAALCAVLLAMRRRRNR